MVSMARVMHRYFKFTQNIQEGTKKGVWCGKAIFDNTTLSSTVVLSKSVYNVILKTWGNYDY